MGIGERATESHPRNEPNHPSRGGGRSGRKTIAVLVDDLDHSGGSYEGRLRARFESTCAALDVNLLIVVGAPLDESNPRLAARNALYDLVHPDCVDGVVLISGNLARMGGTAAVERLAGRLSPLPICSIGHEISGTCSIVIDQRPGMAALLDHVLGDHRCRRVAFIGGPPAAPDAALRLQEYRRALTRHGIDFEPSLLIPGDFYYISAEAGTARLVDSGIEVDAIVAANDLMALGALRALARRGLRVPRDLIVTGFDDVCMASLSDPPLSTVCQPLEEVASLAVQQLLRQIEGEPVACCTRFLARFVQRRSCGCSEPLLEHRVGQRLPAKSSPRTWVVEHAGRLAQALSTAAPMPADVPPDWAAVLVQALERELGGERGALLSSLEQTLEGVELMDHVYEQMQNAITLLRGELREAGVELEDLWHGARQVVAHCNTRHLSNRRWELEMSLLDLLTSGERFSTTLDGPSLKLAMAEQLPCLGIRSGYVARFGGRDRQKVEALFCMRDGIPFELLEVEFQATQLLPPELETSDRRRTWFVAILTSEAEPMGICVFEFTPGSRLADILRNQLSIALSNQCLHNAMVEKTALHERALLERSATNKRLAALGILAGGVAHDLNNALGPLVALPDLILERIAVHRDPTSELEKEIRNDLLEMKSAALHAAQTVNDLSTLGRGGPAPKEPRELNQLVKASAAAAPLVCPGDSCPGDSSRHIDLKLDLLPEPLVVKASASHIVRAVSNLLRNACEAIGGGGTVSVQTARVHLTETLHGYEQVPPGAYAVVTVSDTGRGIPRGDLGHVFEPYFSKKRSDDNLATGLGLAIVLGVVKDHEGFVDLSSTEGVGSTFTLYLPLSKAQAIEPYPRESIAPRGSASILVVDDDPVQLRTVHRILTRLGYSVQTLPSGAMAYEVFVAASANAAGERDPDPPVDLVIFDMLLNEAQDGLEVFERIQGLFRTQKGIIVSGHAPPERARAAMEKGLIWLAKPYTMATLARAVHGAIHPPLTGSDVAHGE